MIVLMGRSGTGYTWGAIHAAPLVDDLMISGEEMHPLITVWLALWLLIWSNNLKQSNKLEATYAQAAIVLLVWLPAHVISYVWSYSVSDAG